jgi:Trypsin-like peptidase domain
LFRHPVLLSVIATLSLVAAARAQTDLLSGATSAPPFRATPALTWFGGSTQPPHPAVVRVIAPERNGASLGSGTLIDVSERHGLVLTNWHVVKDAAGNVIVSFPDGFQTPGYVIKMDRDWDLAAVAIWKPQVKPVPIAPAVPQRGEPLTIAGYGGGNYRAQTGRCVQFLAPAPNMPYDIVEVSAAARHGDSGGPIFNARGELAGVLFGEGGGMTSGSAAARVRWFVASIADKASPETPTQIARAGNSGPARLAAPIAGERLAMAGQAESPAKPGGPVLFQNRGQSDPSSDNLVAVATPSIGSPPPNYPTTNALPLALLPQPPQAQPAAERPANASAKPLPLVSTAPMTPGADPQSAQQIGWEDLVGHTGGQQLKTGLAAFGVLVLLYQLSRRIA